MVGAAIGMDSGAIGSACLIVKVMVSHGEIGSMELGRNGGVGGNALGICFGCKGLDKDGIPVWMVSHHDVLIA